MAGLFGDIVSSLSLSSWYSLRRNSDDSAFEAYDTRAARPLFDFFQTRTTTALTEQTLFLHNCPRDLFQQCGDRLHFSFTFTTDSSAGDCYCRVKFAGTTIFDSGSNVDPSLGNSQTLTISGYVQRVSTVKAICSVSYASTTTAIKYSTAKVTAITGLDLYDTVAGDGTAYDFAVTVETPDNIGDVSLICGEGRFVNASPAAIVTTSLWDYWEADSYSQADGSNITTNWVGKFASKAMTVSGTPTFEETELNGHPIIRFVSASSEYFTLPTMAALTAGHIFIVLKVTDVSVNGGHKLGSYASNDCYYPYAPDTPDGIYEAFGSTDRKTVGGSVSTITDWHVLEMYSATNNWALYQNGQLLHNDTTHTVGFNSAPRIFHNGAAGMTGDLWGVYIHTAKLSDANRAKMYAYIAQTTGV